MFESAILNDKLKHAMTIPLSLFWLNQLNNQLAFSASYGLKQFSIFFVLVLNSRIEQLIWTTKFNVF